MEKDKNNNNDHLFLFAFLWILMGLILKVSSTIFSDH